MSAASFNSGGHDQMFGAHNKSGKRAVLGFRATEQDAINPQSFRILDGIEG
jgi:hypothetical protein